MEHGSANPEVRYEKSDASAPALARFMLYLVVAVLVVAFVVREMYFRLAAWEAARQPPPPVMQFEVNRQPPAPLLEERPQDDLAAYRAEQLRVTTSYGWVDKGRGTVRVPVDEAMRLLLERGLPVAAGGKPPAPGEKK